MIWVYSMMCLIYGTTFLAIRAGDVAGMPPFLFAALRFAAAGVVTLLFMLLRDRTAFPREARVYWRLVSVGFFNTTAVFAIVYDVEQYVPSGYAALMAATMPFMVMLIGRVFDKHSISLMQYIGLFLGFVGVLAIAWPGLRSGVPHWIASTIALVVAQVMAAIGAMQSRKILAEGTSPFVVNGFQVLFGSVGLFVLAVSLEGFSLRSVHAWGTGLMALLYLTVFGSIVASTFYFWLVKRTDALVASTWTYVSPVIAVAVGSYWYNEPVYALTIVGTVVILGGVFTLNLRAFREVYRQHAKLNRRTERQASG
jgi:drug/metabolite transporter (DMT)-like permease